jgi:hypothetical protein
VVGDRRGDRGELPKTYARYLRLCCLVAGVHVDDGVSLDDAIDISSWMNFAKRVPPPSKWVDRAIENEADNEVEGLF